MCEMDGIRIGDLDYWEGPLDPVSRGQEKYGIFPIVGLFSLGSDWYSRKKGLFTGSIYFL